MANPARNSTEMGSRPFKQLPAATFPGCLSPLYLSVRPPSPTHTVTSFCMHASNPISQTIHIVVNFFNPLHPTNMQRGAFASRTLFRSDAEPRLPEITQNTPALPRASASSPPLSSALPAEEAKTSNSSSNFFQLLSPEIQDSILTFAFGNRIIHLELSAENSQWRLRGFVCARSPALPTEQPDAGPVNDLCLQSLAHIQSLAKPPPDFQDPEKGYQIGALGWLLSSKQA